MLPWLATFLALLAFVIVGAALMWAWGSRKPMSRTIKEEHEGWDTGKKGIPETDGDDPGDKAA